MPKSTRSTAGSPTWRRKLVAAQARRDRLSGGLADIDSQLAGYIGESTATGRAAAVAPALLQPLPKKTVLPRTKLPNQLTQWLALRAALPPAALLQASARDRRRAEPDRLAFRARTRRHHDREDESGDTPNEKEQAISDLDAR